MTTHFLEIQKYRCRPISVSVRSRPTSPLLCGLSMASPVRNPKNLEIIFGFAGGQFLYGLVHSVISPFRYRQVLTCQVMIRRIRVGAHLTPSLVTSMSDGQTGRSRYNFWHWCSCPK